MPELPEVETVRRGLADICKDNPLLEKFVFHRADLRFPFAKAKLQKLQGQHIVAIQRRAKYLLIRLESGISLLSHLGMTGTWRTESAGFEKRTHDHVELHLSSSVVLVYNDPRRFGYLTVSVSDKTDPYLRHLGPEPLSEEFSAEYLFAQTRKKTATIKALMMDQRIVVGVGNIYASEALFLAGVRPTRKAGKVTAAEAARIVAGSQQVLKQAIEAGGSSISDFYSFGETKGSFQKAHQVYDRAGEPCNVCRTKIQSKVIAGRNSYWCPTCQK